MARKKMKLYIWEGVLTDYTDGMMFAVAPDVESARKQLREKCNYLPEGDLAQEPVEHDLSTVGAWYMWGGG